MIYLMTRGLIGKNSNRGVPDNRSEMGGRLIRRISFLMEASLFKAESR